METIDLKGLSLSEVRKKWIADKPMILQRIQIPVKRAHENGPLPLREVTKRRNC